MRRLDVGLIGAGLIARLHLEAWLQAGAQVRVYSTDGAAADLAREYGVSAAASLDEAFAGATVADVCTPTETHLDIVLAAIDAGLGIVCEKPLAHTVAEAELIADAARRAGVRVYPAHNMRFFEPYERLHRLVAAGAVGEPAVARFVQSAFHPRSWSGIADQRSGGILTDQMIHGMDMAYWILGEVVRVQAWYRGRLESPAPMGSVAVGTAVLTHAGGAVSRIVGAWERDPSPVRGVAYVAGSAGSITFDSTAHRELRVVAGSADGLPTYFGGSPFQAEIGEFAAAFAGGPEPRVGIDDAVAAVRISHAAARSAWTGQVVELAPAGAADPPDAAGPRAVPAEEMISR